MSTKSGFFDAHAHPQFAAYNEDREEVVRRAIKAGVVMVAVGTQKDTSRRALELAEEHPSHIWAAVGLHPIHISKSYHDAEELGGGEAARGFTSRGEEFDYEYYRELACDPKVVAIGECGLDYFRDKSDETIKRQKEGLVAQIELAAELKKPLMIHCRAAFPDLIEILEAERARLHGGITHFFSGSVEDARKLLEFGLYFTFGGVITFARDYDGIIKMIPLDRILSETDAPYVSPAPYRGKRNEPAYVVEVVKKLAEIKNVSFEKTAEQIWQNAKNAFLF